MKPAENKFYIRLLNSISGLSWSTLYRISSGLSFLLFRVVGYRKKVILSNLKASFPDKSPAEIQAISRQFFLHFTDIILETIKYRSCSAQEVLQRIEGDIGLVDRLFQEKKNAVFLMGHRGNWELANLFSSLRFSHECIVVYKTLSNKPFDAWFLALRTRFGARLVPMEHIAAELQKPRIKPYVVVLANDQSPPPATAYWTTFLNQDTGVFRGVEVIARRNNLTVLYADFQRIEEKRGFYTVTISEIAADCRELKKNEILEKQVRLLERDIRQQPFNWLWSHRRWKHARPQKETTIA
ncbi:lysophospholipid acyltransferase family protein [Arundinibacter roseus]|uniref:Lipid A biosynthesis acyltransferase n=1 Tax=Arundinibacter roseus TaxID=2070510 RepID=A0A4R4KN06_9BACT|nr:lysophospholipid acyltransferase family protein [Arundinibacter roseus]TDB68089.1 lipid A biosynthesis acyltransferase [Arundinibacter roseus]